MKNATEPKGLPRRVLALVTALLLTLSLLPGSFAVSAEETASDTFYVDGSAAASGDGLTPETAVKTLSEGYALLDKAAGGKLVLCGPVEGGGFDAAGSAVTGPVTITGTGKGALVLTGDAATLTFSGTTVLENLTVQKAASADGKSLFLYSGADLTLGENMNITGTGALKVFCSDPNGTRDVQVHCLSGTYHTFFMGGNSGSTTGNVDLTIGGTTEVTSNVTLGPNSTSKAASVSGNLHFTMEGGSIKVLYNTPNTSGTTGNVTVDLKAGTITDAARQYGKATTMGDITVNLYGGFSALPATFGTWPNATTGKRVLNLMDLQGSLTGGACAKFDEIHVAAQANAIYDAALTGKTLSVEAGGKIWLKAYENEAAASADGMTLHNSGTIYYGQEDQRYLSVAFVDGTRSASGDGKTAETAFASLPEALKALDPAVGGTVVLSGEVRMTASLDLESLNVTGPVTLTSRYDGVDYRDTGARLTWVGEKQSFAASGDMTVDALVFHMESTKSNTSQFIYAGSRFHVTDSVVTTGAGALKIFCGKLNSDETSNSTVLLEGGTYNQIYLGSNGQAAGNAELTIDKNASVTSNVAMGGNAKANSVNNVTFTMKGGYVKVIYDISNGGVVHGDVTMNLLGGSITEMRDYNGKSGIVMEGNITVNVDSAFNCGTGMFGVWSSAVTVSGTKTLNIQHYSGSDMASLTHYDTVNVFGGEIPAGFSEKNPAHSMNVYDYSGVLGLTLTDFDTFTASGTSNVSLISTVPTTVNGQRTKLVANDGAVLRISPSANPGVQRSDFDITENGTGKVLLEDPPFVGQEIVLQADFNDGTAADRSGHGNHGRITGSPAAVTGADGTSALYIHNTFGKDNATEYVRFENLQGIDLSTDSYTLAFWYRTVNGGHTQWAAAGLATKAGSPVDMNSVKAGGVLFSNQDTAQDTSGISAVQLPQNQYLTLGLTDTDGNHADTDGIRSAMDDRWHRVTVSVDRTSSYKIYVDQSLVAIRSISALAGQALGENTLVLGADLAGQFGLENAYLDNVTLYKGVLSHTDVLATYHAENLRALIAQAESRMGELGSEYDPYRAALSKVLTETKAAAENLTAADYQEAVRLTGVLKDAYLTFLSAPQKDADLSALLLSDIHIASPGDVDSKRLETVFADLKANDLVPDVFLNSGDFADNSKPATTQNAYDVFNALTAQYGLEDLLMLACFGNHEISWDAPDANYLASSPVYWQNIMAHIQKFVDSGAATLDSVNYDADADESHSYSYTVSYKGFHFVIINTDYKLQTGSSKEVLDENGNYAIEGNELDPIRHGGYYEDETLAWLEQWMSTYAADGKPVFVINHFPFIDTCPLSTYSPIVINDNSIGAQDAQVRSILAAHDNVVYFCGHLHSAFGMVDPVEVVSEGVGSFTEVNLPAIKGATRAYANVPANYLMYVYEDEIVLRARDYTTGEWLPQFDAVIPLTHDCRHSNLTFVEAKEPTVDAEGNIAYYVCPDCGKLFADAEGKEEISPEDVVVPKLPQPTEPKPTDPTKPTEKPTKPTKPTEKPTEPTKPSTTPATGDRVNVPMLVLLAAAALTAAGATLVLMGKKKR